ncbi:MAG: CBS domain-containing protein [Bdellovibrionales bacterium]|nr:CBS domain-containing protein [Bdellovibrionales bacterium]
MKTEHKFVSPRLLCVRADTSIGECVRIMRESNVGSVVIVSDNTREEVVGIFTERDLLRHIELIQRGRFWDKSVRTVMTKNVVTITADQIPDAARLMLKHRFRHLPVVAEINGTRKLVGVLSMRDLFKTLLERYSRDVLHAVMPVFPDNKLGVPAELGVLSKHAAVNKFLKDTFSATPHVLVRRISPRYLQNQAALISGIYRLKTLVFDIDNLKADRWGPILRQVNSDAATPHVIVLFDPALHDAKERLVLERLGASPKFTVMQKPIDLGALFRKMAELVNGHSFHAALK